VFLAFVFLNKPEFNFYMKTLTKSFLAFALVLIAFSCREDEVTNNKILISFGIDQKDFESGRLKSTEVPSSLVVSVTKTDGTPVFENKKLSLLQFGSGYVTEGVELVTGNYKITKFLVLNALDKVVYATPLEGSDKASLVNDPLPINFTVTLNSTSTVVPQVVSVTSTDTPQSFGYTSFGFSIVENQLIWKLKMKVQFLVGEILYQDINSTIRVNGYDSLNNIKWSQDFSFVGPTENELGLKASFHHYTAEVNQWGVHDKITITRENLLNSRADGPSPVTYILSGASPARKISSLVTYFERSEPTNPGSTYFEPESKTEYQYGASGKIEKIIYSSHSLAASTFVPQQYFKFAYDGNHVIEITGYESGTDLMTVQTFYSYGFDGNLTDMLQKNYSAQVNGNVHLSYLSNSVVKAEYKFSNGGSFEYEFSNPWKSVTADKTTKGNEVCNVGVYTNDKNINPFKQLGYIDFTFRDYSINNRLTENVNYLGCAFPSLMPESYSYEYNVYGYPTSQIKYYKKNSAGVQARSQTKYFYQ
jgi:hypothetical protein